MPPSDPPTPLSRITVTPQRSLVTTGGVTVNVYHHPTPEPRPAPPPPEVFPKVIILPPGQTAREREKIIRELYDQHGDFILKTLLREPNVVPESAQDLQQRVLLILCDRVDDKEEPLHNVRGFLVDVIQKEAANYRRLKRHDAVRGVDVDEELSPSTGPEAKLMRAELREKLRRYLTCLPPEEQSAVRCVDFEEMTLDAAAKALRRPRSTVADHLARGRERLDELARASERAAELGQRRRPAK